MSKRPEELVVDALNDVKEIFADIWGHGYETGIKAADKATEKRVLDEVRAFIEIVANNYYKATMFDHSSAASCIAEELKQKYGGSDE